MTGYEPVGQGFESLTARQKSRSYQRTGFLLFSSLLSYSQINPLRLKNPRKKYIIVFTPKEKGVFTVTLKLFFQALVKFISGIVLVGVLIFLPAGSLGYFNGRLLMDILFVPMFIAGIVMIFKSPGLLEKRLNAKEKRQEQDLVVKLSGLMFLTGFIVSGLGFRFGWYILPKAVSVAGAVMFLISYLLYAEVMRENAYLSRTIEVQKNQKVVDTGLYGIVRHPMYSVTLILFLSMPIVLGSVYAFLIFLVYPFIISRRIKDEEELLEKELDGYKEYKQKVKYRLIPFIW